MRRIMIIDDDATSLAIGKAFLEDEYEILTAHSGPQAIGTLKSEELPELILLDMLMPGMDGLEVLKQLKSDGRLKNIPVVFLTGERSIELEIKGYSSGASGFLLKPVDRYLLRIKIRQQLDIIDIYKENIELKSKLGIL